MSDLVPAGQSPFDAIKRVDEQGEYWTGRDLMPVMGYDKWERFAEAIERARVAIANSGDDPDLACSRLREDVVTRGNTPNKIRTNYRMTREAAYLTALNGDPRKAEIAAAQRYFVARTRQAELQDQAQQAPLPAPQPSNLPDLATYEGQVFLLDMYREQVEARRRLELEIEETNAYVDTIEPKAEAYDTFVENHADDYDCREAAAILNREPRITIGPRVLLRKLREWKMIDTWDKPYSAHKTHVHLKPQFFTDKYTGEEREGRPQVRITKLGLSYIRRRLLDELDERGARTTSEPDLFGPGGNVTNLPARRRGKKSGPGSGDATPTGA